MGIGATGAADFGMTYSRPAFQETRGWQSLFLLLCEPASVAANPPGVNVQCFLRDTVFLAAFESSHCGRDLSFSNGRNFFSDHSLNFRLGSCTTLGHTQTAK
jgi:hypothetical protein